MDDQRRDATDVGGYGDNSNMRSDTSITAAEFREQWEARGEHERAQKWRPWVSAAALLGLGAFLFGGHIVRSTAHASSEWWFGGGLVLGSFAILLLTTPVTVIDWYRDIRDLVKWLALVRKERNER